MAGIEIDAALVLLFAFLVDLIYGEYPLKFHPVYYMGIAIESLTKFSEKREKYASIYGAFVFIAVTFFFSAISFFLLTYLSRVAKIIIGALILKSTFSFKMLREVALSTGYEIERNIKKAREMLKALVGRETEELDKELCISAVIESIGDSICDSIIAPLFYFFFFSFHSIELGISAAVFYRAANTLDSMVGYPGIAIGRFSAKADEVLNLIPARISAFLLLLSGIISGKEIKKALNVFLFERFKTPSINAGQGIAMLAGLLNVKLEKKGFYKIGTGEEMLTTEKIRESIKLLDLSVFIFLPIVFIILFLLGFRI